jgi:hypothetical protein
MGNALNSISFTQDTVEDILDSSDHGKTQDRPEHLLHEQMQDKIMAVSSTTVTGNRVTSVYDKTQEKAGDSIGDDLEEVYNRGAQEEETQTDRTEACKTCGKQTSMKCSQCKIVHYCSKEHQTKVCPHELCIRLLYN